jgi:hypothetical protein
MKSKMEYDLRFWPKMFDRKWAEYFLQYNKDNSRADTRDSHINPVIKAYKEGLEIKSVDVEYNYDESEINIEVTRELREKRLEQYRSLLAELLKENKE